MSDWHANTNDLHPLRIAADYTGPETFELVRWAIHSQIERATIEVDRLTDRVKYSVRHMTDGADASIPAFHRWSVSEDMIALQSARAQLAAVKQVWAAVHGHVACPIWSATAAGLTEAVDDAKQQRREHLDAWALRHREADSR